MPDYRNLESVTHDFQLKAKALGCERAWIFKVKKTTLIHDITSKLDRTIAAMPNSEQQKLSDKFSKITPNRAPEWRDSYNDRFLDTIVEILGWGWLSNKFRGSKIEFNETPDLIVSNADGESIAAMECKNFSRSDWQKEYFKHHQGKAMDVDTSLVSKNPQENPLLRKLISILQQARSQLAKAEPLKNRYIFISFWLDVSAKLPEQKTQIMTLITSEADNLSKEGIELIAFEQWDERLTLICRGPQVNYCLKTI